LGCSAAGGKQAFKINYATVRMNGTSLNVKVSETLQLSQDAVDALQHGIALTIGLESELRSSSSLALIDSTTRLFQISYLPLSQHYQLLAVDTGNRQTYPRLRHVLGQLSHVQVDLATGALPPGNYQVRTRVRLLRSTLPAPMQLPALMSAQWRHDSDWSVWPFKINA